MKQIVIIIRRYVKWLCNALNDTIVIDSYKIL